MTRPIIRVDGLSKQYRIGALQEPYGNLREAINRAARAPFNRIREVYHNTRAALRKQPNGGVAQLVGEQSPNTIWALKDVSFEVQPGEVLGIIGRNGAGKSTLLKVLSRVTEPTSGRAELYGHVSSLLEVGTGFHPELTGRENIYLNGAILGLTRFDIARRMEEIVEFAEVGAHIDTPVKRFSSGMYLRLAFAVAAHVEPDILIVDEVLAVGDANFQKKCLDKMANVSSHGRTILFVSHNLSSIKALCHTAIHVDAGQIVARGGVAQTVDAYASAACIEIVAAREWRDPILRPGTSPFHLIAMRVVDSSGEPNGMFYSSSPPIVEMEFELEEIDDALTVGFELTNQSGVTIFRTSQNDTSEEQWPSLRVGRNLLRCQLPHSLLSTGEYFIAPKVDLQPYRRLIDGNPEIGFSVILDHGESPFWNLDPQNRYKFSGVISPCLTWHRAS